MMNKTLIKIEKKPYAEVTLDCEKFKETLRKNLNFQYALDQSIGKIKTKARDKLFYLLQEFKMLSPYEAILENLNKKEIKIKLHHATIKDLPVMKPGIKNSKTMKGYREFDRADILAGKTIAIADCISYDENIENFINKFSYTTFDYSGKILWR